MFRPHSSRFGRYPADELVCCDGRTNPQFRSNTTLTLCNEIFARKGCFIILITLAFGAASATIGREWRRSGRVACKRSSVRNQMASTCFGFPSPCASEASDVGVTFPSGFGRTSPEPLDDSATSLAFVLLSPSAIALGL